jgi:hypothetical protein
MKPNKEICRKCFFETLVAKYVKKYRSSFQGINIDFNSGFDSAWKKGQHTCPNTSLPKTMPPDDCPYILEHIVSC